MAIVSGLEGKEFPEKELDDGQRYEKSQINKIHGERSFVVTMASYKYVPISG